MSFIQRCFRVESLNSLTSIMSPERKPLSVIWTEWPLIFVYKLLHANKQIGVLLLYYSFHNIRVTICNVGLKDAVVKQISFIATAGLRALQFSDMLHDIWLNDEINMERQPVLTVNYFTHIYEYFDEFTAPWKKMKVGRMSTSLSWATSSSSWTSTWWNI